MCSFYFCKSTAVNKKKKKKYLIVQYFIIYTAVMYSGIEDSKTRRKTKQSEPRTSTVRTLGVDWAAHGKPKPWWAAHGSLVWPYGLHMAAPLWGCGLCTPMGFGPKDERMVDGPPEDLVFLTIVIYLFF